MRGRSRVLAGVVLLSLAAGACGGGALHVPPHVTVDARGVQVVGASGPDEEEDFPAALNAYLPGELTVRPGDRVFFDAEFTGQPHTITMGTLVDDAATAIEGLGRNATLHDIEALPAMQGIPSMFPRAPGEGPLQANRSATEPCFLDTGAPPNPPEGGAPPCPEQEQPLFDGTQAFYSSGWIGDETFDVTFAEDIPQGTYAFMCLVHRSRMMGTVEVVGPDEERPSQPDVADAAGGRLGGLIQSLETPADDLAVATSENALAGISSPTGQAELTAFAPERVEVAEGGTVSWAVSGLHTITLEPAEDPGELFVETDGARGLNQAVVAPSEGAPAVPPHTRAFPPPLDGVPLTLTTTWDGEGSFNSGLLWSMPPVAVTYQVTFTSPGTYTLQCLVHPLMEAVVEVE